MQVDILLAYKEYLFCCRERTKNAEVSIVSVAKLQRKLNSQPK